MESTNNPNLTDAQGMLDQLFTGSDAINAMRMRIRMIANLVKARMETAPKTRSGEEGLTYNIPARINFGEPRKTSWVVLRCTDGSCFAIHIRLGSFSSPTGIGVKWTEPFDLCSKCELPPQYVQEVFSHLNELVQWAEEELPRDPVWNALLNAAPTPAKTKTPV